MKKRYKILISLAGLTILMTMFFTACQNRKTEGTEGDLSAAVKALLYTTDTGNQSQIMWWNDEWQVIGTSRYAFSGASLDGFKNASVSDGKLILVPRGEAQERDYGKIVLIDTSDGTYETIDIGRINPTSFDVERNMVAVTSNLNMECFIDVADITTKSVQSMSLNDYGLCVTDVVLVNGEVYGVAVRNDLESSLLCHIDVHNQICEEIMPLSDDSPFLGKHGDDVVLTSHDKMIRYNTKSKEYTEQTLTRNDAFNINICGDVILIAYTNIHDREYDSLVEARDYATNTVIGEMSQPGAILQLESDGELMYVLGYDKLYQYRMQAGKFTLIKSISCEMNGYYLGGFYHFGK